MPDPGETFGVREIDGHHYIGKKHVIVKDNNIIVDGDTFLGTPGLWKLMMSRNPPEKWHYSDEDYDNYERMMLKTNVLHQNDDPNNPHPRSNKGKKWTKILGPIWDKYKVEKEHERRRKERFFFGFEGKGVVVIPSDPNALLERLDLLLASQEAGHTGVGNELESICDELKRQGVLDMNAYKKLNSLLKK